jgi:glycine/serine hydroxymethyltransferase
MHPSFSAYAAVIVANAAALAEALSARWVPLVRAAPTTT